jgi:hypothetical protein
MFTILNDKNVSTYLRLIGDFMSLKCLSRLLYMEPDILMNISEMESPNYEHVELDLLNLPRDLSTNLNEDSDNQKENVVPNKRFRMVTDEETGVSFKNISTYLIGDFMSLKCLSGLLYMEPRESGSCSVPSFLSTHRKNLATILSRSLGGICRIVNIENNIMSAEQNSVFQNFIIRTPPSFGGYPPYSNHS